MRINSKEKYIALCKKRSKKIIRSKKQKCSPKTRRLSGKK